MASVLLNDLLVYIIRIKNKIILYNFNNKITLRNYIIITINKIKKILFLISIIIIRITITGYITRKMNLSDLSELRLYIRNIIPCSLYVVSYTSISDLPAPVKGYY